MFLEGKSVMKAEDILAQFPLSKSGKQKFLEDVQHYAEYLGYFPKIESGTIQIGDPIQADYFLTCGAAASGVTVWLEILRTFPENQRYRVCFLLSESRAGISAYYKKYGNSGKLLIYLDHVGDGRHMRIYPSRKLAADRVLLTSLYRACGYFGSRDLLVEEGKKPFFLHACTDFPYCVTICALQKRKKRFLYPRKTKDTALDTTNVNILRAALTTYLCCSEVNLERK